MLSIRFKRVGRKKAPSYRIVVMEKQKDPWSNYIEKLGFFDPKSKETVLKKDRIKYWLSVGAQASNTVSNLLLKNGIIEDIKKKAVKISKKRQTKIGDKKKLEEETKAKKEASAVAKALADKEAEAQKEAEVLVEETPVAEEPAKETVVEEAETPTEEISTPVETSVDEKTE